MEMGEKNCRIASEMNHTGVIPLQIAQRTNKGIGLRHVTFSGAAGFWLRIPPVVTLFPLSHAVSLNRAQQLVE